MGKKRGPATAKGSNKKSQQKQPQRKGGGVLAGPTRFARDVRGELRRVSWPNRDQLRQSTAVVLIIVIVLAIYVAALDFVFQSLVRLIFL
ncbi:MAG TPA: preprotein translocase subunit SecE [Rubrobacter sp.]|nr:preprotein translocase subunit SecE [Rubrobacter sp.]